MMLLTFNDHLIRLSICYYLTLLTEASEGRFAGLLLLFVYSQHLEQSSQVYPGGKEAARKETSSFTLGDDNGTLILKVFLEESI